MNCTISELLSPLRGLVRVPGDKSISHRAFLINALGRGTARIRGALDSEDVARSRALVESIGAQLERVGDDWILTAGSLCEPPDVIDCGNSGTTMRLGAGVVAHAPGVRVLTGDHSLRRRPMARIVKPLRTLGLNVQGRTDGRVAPLVVQGTPTERASFDLSIASAQLKSAVLLASRDLGVRVREPRASRDHTERMIRAMGGDLFRDDGWWTLEPGPWSAVDVDVPGDLSSAAFWLVAASLKEGSEVELPNVGLNATRDGILRALKAMGADIMVTPTGKAFEPQGTLVARGARLRGTRIDGELALACLDELPVLAVAAALAEGETVIADAAELRVKESDRIAVVVGGLRAMGVDVEERPDGMVIQGGCLSGPQATIDADGDHRIAMAFSVAGLFHPEGVRLTHADSVRTSYPEFFEHLAHLSKETS